MNEVAQGTDLQATANSRHCKFCKQTVPRAEWSGHLLLHGLLVAQYDDFEPGQPRPKVIEAMTIERVHPPMPEPTPAEPVVTMRLMDIESNPVRVPVEARPSCVYHFERGKWQDIPAPDARLLLPSELSPGRYAHLRFERKPEPKKRRRKARK